MINDDIPPLEDMSAFIKRPSISKPVSKAQAKQNKSEFSGLVKGFFDSKTKKTPEIIELKPKTTKNPLILDQVQKEMPKTDWITQDILEKIDKSPVLSKAFQDPMFTTAVSEMASNTSEALKKYSNRPDLILALKEFATLMGHTAAINQIPKDLPIHEQELLKNVFGNVEIQEALKDPVIQQILSESTKNPMALSRALHSARPDIQKKIKLLLHAGILSAM